MCSIIDPQMYPTKNTFDYMNEINRLFPRIAENDALRSPNTTPNLNLSSLFIQPTQTNRSSSSTDTSPDSFPDMSHCLDTDRQAYETPFIVRRQRPIVGRKIFDNPERVPPTLKQTGNSISCSNSLNPFEHNIEFPSTTIWQPDSEHHLFPPTPPSNSIEQKNYSQNYELFPTEERGFEFKPPVSTFSPVSNYMPASPKFSQNSSKVSAPCMPLSPFRQQNRPNYGPTSFKHKDTRPSKMCTFCRKNGETPLVYMTHAVRETVGNQNIVTCPILRSHVCSTCGASGDNAHTITYCPVLRSGNNGRPLQSTTITLKNTRIKSNGRRRF